MSMRDKLWHYREVGLKGCRLSEAEVDELIKELDAPKKVGLELRVDVSDRVRAELQSCVDKLGVLGEVSREMDKQEGEPPQIDLRTEVDWCNFVNIQLCAAEAIAHDARFGDSPLVAGTFREHMLQVATLAVLAIEAHDRKANT